MLKEKHTFGKAMVEKNKILGFIIGTSQTDKMFLAIIQENFLRFFILSIFSILKNPKLVLKIFETLLYNKKLAQFKKIPKSELLFIGVLPQKRGGGTGSKLVKSFEKQLKDKNIGKYRVCLYKTHKKSENFYLKNNFEFFNKFHLYNKTWKIYVKNL